MSRPTHGQPLLLAAIALLLPLFVGGCQVIAVTAFMTVYIVTEPARQVQVQALNHHFLLAGTVVDEDGVPLKNVTLTAWSVPPSIDYFHYRRPWSQPRDIQGAFEVDTHGREVLLWFSKDGYLDTKLAFYPESADLKTAGSPTPRTRPVSRLSWDTQDAFVALRQRDHALRVVLRRPGVSRLREYHFTLELSPDSKRSSWPIPQHLLSPEMRAWPSTYPMALRLSGTPSSNYLYLDGTPLVPAAGTVTALQQMHLAPPLAFESFHSLDLTRTPSGHPQFVYAKLGLFYARGAVTLLPETQGCPKLAEVMLQVQENGSRSFD
jgi:hypothetical protein